LKLKLKRIVALVFPYPHILEGNCCSIETPGIGIGDVNYLVETPETSLYLTSRRTTISRSSITIITLLWRILDSSISTKSHTGTAVRPHTVSVIARLAHRNTATTNVATTNCTQLDLATAVGKHQLVAGHTGSACVTITADLALRNNRATLAVHVG
jgi:hypothetical protein